MLDINFVKENPEIVRKTLKDRKIKEVDLDQFLIDYSVYLDLLQKVEIHRGLRNRLSEDISKVSAEERAKLIQEASQVKSELQDMEKDLGERKAKIDTVLPLIPNVPSPDMPVGSDEHENIIVKVWNPGTGYYKLGESFSYDDYSYAPKESFPHKDHMEIGEILDLIDTAQSGKVSGSRFYYLKNEAVLLEEAIFSLLKKKLLSMGYHPMMPPLLVKERALFGTSHFPEGRDQVYKIENANVEEGNELYLIGSSEPANFSYFMDKTLEKDKLPFKVYAQTTCFRSEVGSWGKDVRGIKRVHQFDKLEMNAICAEGQDRIIFDEFLSINEWLYQQLELPYRVVNKCTGDCGYNASYFQYDIEVWRPAEKEYMEVGTNTMTTDYQARRLNIRYKDENRLKYVRTVNDTGASTRPLVALLENHQMEDGTVLVPAVLVPYLGFDKILPKNKY